MEQQGKGWALALALGALAVGCGTAEPVRPETGCTSGAAAIGVTDGMVSILCGCAEPGGAWVANGANLTCTVAAGTTIVFHYITPLHRHQIVSKPTASRSFAPSPVFAPDAATPIRAHAVQLGTSGTYEFTDSYDSSLSATINVP